MAEAVHKGSGGTRRHDAAGQAVAIEPLSHIEREFLLIDRAQQYFQLIGLVRVQLSDRDFDTDRIG